VNLKDIKESLHAKALTPEISLDTEITSAIASDLMSDVLHSQSPADVLLTGLTNNQAVRTCDISGIKAIIFVRGKLPGVDTVRLAESCNIPLLACNLSMFEVCGLLFSLGIRTPCDQNGKGNNSSGRI
jgi:hypothetical protein